MMVWGIAGLVPNSHATDAARALAPEESPERSILVGSVSDRHVEKKISKGMG